MGESIKGLGIDHFLCDLRHDIIMKLENQTAATSLVSIDFSKAFDRMDHRECLRALPEHGIG